MKPDPHDPLLAAVLLDDETFRDTTLHHTLAAAGRRRRHRVARRAVAFTALVCAAVVVLRLPSFAPWNAPPVAEKNVASVRAAPPSAFETIHTERTTRTVASSTSGALKIVSSRRGTVAIIETRGAASRVAYLTDTELIAAFPGRRAALIAAGTPEARLILY